MIDPSQEVPLWANILIYMAMYQWYLLAAILPTIYLVVVKLFGFPLLQRFSQEVIIILYPTRVKMYKLVNEEQPYFGAKNGLYWRSNPLTNVNQSHKFTTMKGDKSGRCLHILEETEEGVKTCNLTKKEHKKIENKVEHNYNTIQIFTHAINQAVYDMERRGSKTDELTNSEHKLKPIPRHGVWIMKNPLQHFHRHWEIVVDPSGKLYELRPVNQRQQFSISLWHTLGITMLKKVQVEKQVESEQAGGTSKQQLIALSVTNQFVVEQIGFVKEYQNFSANAAYRICKRMRKLEGNFDYWASGNFNILPIIILGGAIGCVVLVLYMFHGGGPSLGPMPTK